MEKQMMRAANDENHGNEVIRFVAASDTRKAFRAHERRQFVADMMTGAGFVFFILGCMAMASDVFGG